MLVFTDVPARRLWKGRICATKQYRKMMDLIGKTMKAGGAVEMHVRTMPDAGFQDGTVVEYISGTITPVEQLELWA